LTGIERTLYAAAYPPLSVPHPRVLVIGVGGGFDMLSALYFGASEAPGVEVNRATIEVLTRSYRAYFRPWAWGINGIFSVAAPVLSVAVSMTWGINALLLSAIPFYLVAGLALPEAASHPGVETHGV